MISDKFIKMLTEQSPELIPVRSVYVIDADRQHGARTTVYVYLFRVFRSSDGRLSCATDREEAGKLRDVASGWRGKHQLFPSTPLMGAPYECISGVFWCPNCGFIWERDSKEYPAACSPYFWRQRLADDQEMCRELLAAPAVAQITVRRHSADNYIEPRQFEMEDRIPVACAQRIPSRLDHRALKMPVGGWVTDDPKVLELKKWLHSVPQTQAELEQAGIAIRKSIARHNRLRDHRNACNFLHTLSNLKALAEVTT